MSALTWTAFSGLALPALALFSQPAHSQPHISPTTSSQPNIVLIIADDLGYGGLGVQGDKEVRTPHIDSIAKDGLRFTSGYVTAPVCSPSRAGLLSGRYQSRFGHEMNPGGDKKDVSFGLPLTEETLPARLKKAGYATGMFGKWHLGLEPPYHPQKRGFDEFYGFLGGAHSYLDTTGGRGANAIQHNGRPVGSITYATDEFAARAADFITSQAAAAKPFFAYVPFNAVHTPMHALEKDIERFSHIKDRKRRIHAAMLASMDDGVGKILEAVDRAGATTNTLVFFISDNGGPTRSNTSTNAPLRGYKRDLLEGGIRVPYLVKWAGHIKPGQEDATPVTALDIHATALAVAGTTAPAAQLDGHSLLPHLTGESELSADRPLYWRFGPQWAVRKGEWKLINTGVAGEKVQLYNLVEDPSEKKNLAAQQPEKFAELQKLYEAWSKDLPEPLWAKDTNLRGASVSSEDKEAEDQADIETPSPDTKYTPALDKKALRKQEKREMSTEDRRARKTKRKAARSNTN